MGKRDPRVDDYIKKAPAYARPILTTLREVMHDACPDVVETIKWRGPCFEHEGLMCMMAAFKHYASLAFWKEKLVYGSDDGELRARLERVTSVDALPARTAIAALIRKATALNQQRVKVQKQAARKASPLRVPSDLAAALKKHAKARKAFTDFSPSHRNEYIQWITEAKGTDTRARRVAQTIEWVAEGKSRNWKYERRAVR